MCKFWMKVNQQNESRAPFQYKDNPIKTIPGMGILMLKIRRWWDGLILNMGISILQLVRQLLYIEMAPGVLVPLWNIIVALADESRECFGKTTQDFLKMFGLWQQFRNYTLFSIMSECAYFSERFILKDLVNFISLYICNKIFPECIFWVIQTLILRIMEWWYNLIWEFWKLWS